MMAIETQNLSRRFGTHIAVDALHLSIREGTIYGLLGLNGAGKSTTIKMLCTLIPPSAGEARILGHDVIKEALEVRGLVGLLGDDGGDSQPSWSALEFLDYFARLSALPATRTPEVLDLVGLDRQWRHRPMGSYSTGMRRRVELARALLSRPRVLFLDEPTRGLDLPAKRQMWTLMRDLAHRDKVTILVSSHEVNEIQALCQDLAVMHKGRVTFQGPISTLGNEPKAFEDRLISLLQGDENTDATKTLTEFRAVKKNI